MRKFFAALFNSQDPTVDSLNVGGLGALLTLVIFTAYSVLWLHQDFSASNFGTGVAAILGGIGIGKRLRDGVSNVTDPGPQQPSN